MREIKRRRSFQIPTFSKLISKITLTKLGFDVYMNEKISNTLGRCTRQAVIAFQRKYGLGPADGIVNKLPR